MNKGILGRKVGMTQIFETDGTRVPVTVLEVTPNVVVALRTPEKDGYAAVQVGFGARKDKHTTKPQAGHFKKAGVAPVAVLKELRLSAEELEGVTVGDQIDAGIFEKGMRIDVTATTKGKGFQGVLRRHHMKGMRATHGTHEKRRNPGSIGNRKTPGRTFKNKRLPGHMGHLKVTTQNLTVAGVDTGNNLLLVRGTVPGAKGAVVLVRPAVKGQKKATAA